MSETIRYAGYPSAKVFDAEGHQIQHCLWGDWVRVTGAATGDLVPVRVRGHDGFMRSEDLQDERLLEVVFVDVGQGDGCLVVTPDDRKLVVDAGIGDNMARFLDWRFRFAGGVREMDAAIITHPDKDHYFGFKALFAEPNLRWHRVYHNGIMEQKPKSRPFGPQTTAGSLRFIRELVTDQAQLEAFLAEPQRYGSKLYANLLADALDRVTASDSIRMLAASPDAATPSWVEGFGADQELRLRVLGPVPEPSPSGSPRLRWFEKRPDGGGKDPGKTKNGHSIILRLEYRNLNVLLGGDLNASSEAFLLKHYTGISWPPAHAGDEQTLVDAARQVFGADIAKSCHHGSADFTDTFMAAVHPAATIVSSGDEESHAHPRCDTLGAIGRHGRGWRPLILSTELSRSTREDEGDRGVALGELMGKIDALGSRQLDDAEARRQRDEEIDALRAERDALVERLAERNVTTYGAINLRSDGRKAVLAYKLEVARQGRSGGKRTLGKWDIYRLESVGGGPLVYVSGRGGH